MDNFQTFRQIFYDLRKNLFHYRRKLVPLPVEEGLPPGLDADMLDRVCQEQGSGRVKSVKYQHLSGWKASGAYRLHIKILSGREIRLVYKEAVYGYENIPALADLPVCPGPAEFAVFSQPFGELAPFLPRVYLAEERIPGKHYCYIVEDLSEDYHYVEESSAAFLASKMLPKLHLALSAWSEKADTNSFIEYGINFSKMLQQYAQNNLVAYRRVAFDPSLNKVLENWSEITELHLHPGFFTLQPSIPIHGDTNFTNIYIHNKNPDDFKVVDWEWAGFGSPFADLVSLMKGMPLLMERKALSAFISQAVNLKSGLMLGLNDKEYRQFYYWCQIERGMLDAAFLSSQLLNSSQQGKFSLSTAVSSSLQRMLTAYQQLTT
jgi:hypothetical protein